MVERLAAARHLVVLLDYDGTLVNFHGDPDQAIPDPALVELIRSLSTSAGVNVHIISGRLRWWLERCFGRLHVGLHAEHGLWSRMPGDSAWAMVREVPTDWKQAVRPLLDQFTRATNGSFVEEKTASLAWHYRNATADFETAGDFGEHQAKELRLLLGELLSSAPMEVISGAKVVEVRQQGIGKGGIVPSVLASVPADAAILAIGDDRTDEELFSALPPAAQSIHVGSGPSLARWRADSIEAVLELLNDLRDARERRANTVHS
jgi:trehalose 6-phosphate synthase/phosphatase